MVTTFIEAARTRPAQNVIEYEQRKMANQQLSDGFLSNIWDTITGSGSGGLLPTVNVEYEMSKKDRTALYTIAGVLAAGMVTAAIIRSQ